MKAKHPPAKRPVRRSMFCLMPGTKTAQGERRNPPKKLQQYSVTRSLRITTQKEKEKQLHSTCPILPGQWDSAPRRFFPVTKLPSQRRASAQPAFQAFQVPQQRPAWVPPHPRDQQSRGVWRPPGARKKGRTAHSRLGRKQWRPFPYPL